MPHRRTCLRRGPPTTRGRGMRGHFSHGARANPQLRRSPERPRRTQRKPRRTRRDSWKLAIASAFGRFLNWTSRGTRKVSRSAVAARQWRSVTVAHGGANVSAKVPHHGESHAHRGTVCPTCRLALRLPSLPSPAPRRSAFAHSSGRQIRQGRRRHGPALLPFFTDSEASLRPARP